MDAGSLSQLESESIESVIERGLWRYHRLLPPLVDSPWRSRFERLLKFFLYYTSFWLPMRVSFFQTNPPLQGVGWELVDGIDFAIDALFWVDIAITCRTCYYDKVTKELVTDWRQIMRRYTAAAFADDALSSPDGKGVLIHQLDGWEDDDKPWLPCHSRTGRSCGKFGDRISCMLIYESMGDREDRATIPLFSWSGGLVVRAEESKPLCLFGCDGATRNHNCPSHPATCVPGCGNPPWWCDRERPLLANDCRCGLEACSGHISAWRPSDVAFVMEAHEEHGPKYKFEPGYHTGYNEVVVESDAWEAHLPRVVQAFFFVDGGSDEASIRDMHARFLDEYGLTGRDCPLLRMDRGRWDAPFEVVVG